MSYDIESDVCPESKKARVVLVGNSLKRREGGKEGGREGGRGDER